MNLAIKNAPEEVVERLRRRAERRRHGELLAIIALESGLTAYDAAYLWLSRNLGAELVTLDQQLARTSPGVIRR